MANKISGLSCRTRSWPSDIAYLEIPTLLSAQKSTDSNKNVVNDRDIGDADIRAAHRILVALVYS
ncbi:hypothetical protein GCM10007920_37080 [Ciceribacter naphthalenivorans]|uniref:Uncharacterized protein n=2 Tax=Alphaproteobacteria TaxID=28211 RepID=A0A512HQ52_9HYPH|nr:hypothetical protein RNA01_45190 [Ciceribacter naphthalenivorans]GLR23914.1 hypothetical protein GCM10007920_37080 [Ciceribacter naphthalenivorans]GLT06770.1 hypothetical protein GCM10007926_37080 [Sphingomonas psychrolutea]